MTCSKIIPETKKTFNALHLKVQFLVKRNELLQDNC